MTFLEIQNLVLSWLDDLSATYFTRPQIKVWINNAQKECQKQLIQAGENFYVVKVSSNLIANQDTYSLPSDFLKCHKMEIAISGTGVSEQRALITPVTLVQIDQVSMTTGQPSAYVIKKNCFVLRPIPDRIYPIYLNQSYRVTDMTIDTQTPDVPEQYHEYLAVLASLDGFLKDQRDNSMMMMKKQYYLDLMKQDAQERRVDAPRMVVSSEDLGYGILY